MIDQYPPANGVLTSLIWRKTAAGGETSLSGYDNASQALSYTPGQEQVYLNGILLVRGSDYTATNGTSITGLSALAADDFVQINCYNNFSVASVPAASITGTVTNDQLAGSIANNKLANSSITINGSATSLGGSYTNASASTSTAGIVQLTDSTSSTSTTTAATPNSVKSAYDLANGAIPKTLTTTTGDIIYASGANTPDRLGIGSSNQVLTVSGGVPVWATASGIPAGTVINVAMNTAPTGFLKANGAEISRSTYATLFSAIGTTFGVGNGSTTFNLPDMRGYFTRNWADDVSSGVGRDAGRTFGTTQTATGLQSEGMRTYFANTEGDAYGTGNVGNFQNTPFQYNVGASYSPIRPQNIALLAVIKF